MNLKMRFEILKRDGFRCRYCGADQTKSLLQVDHVHPKSRGGIDHVDNLVTACFECNQGKKATPLRPVPVQVEESEYSDETSLAEQADSIIGLIIGRYHDANSHYGYDLILPDEITEWAAILRSAGIGEWLAISVLFEAGLSMAGLSAPDLRTLLQDITLAYPGFQENLADQADQLRATWPRLRVVK